MSLILKGLKIKNFRNHHTFDFNDPGRLILIVGRNASGKTNIIEALQLVSMIKSFRNPSWESVVGFGGDITSVEAFYLQNERTIEIRMEIQNGRRSYFLNGKKKYIGDINGLVPGVIFIPDDLNLIKGPAEGRRDLIDDIGRQLSQNYSLIVGDYKKTVKQRNMLLKNHKERRGVSFNGEYKHVLSSWDDNLIKLGALLFIHRMKLYGKYMEKVSFFYAQLVENETLTSEYVPSFEKFFSTSVYENIFELKKEDVEELLYAALEAFSSEELIRGKTLVGPHRDEIYFFINGMNARQYASQGQQRSIALALKLAQLSLIRELSGNQPLLLLDDVLSELDENRRAELIKVIDGQVQTIITATDLSGFSEDVLVNAQIIELK